MIYLKCTDRNNFIFYFKVDLEGSKIEIYKDGFWEFYGWKTISAMEGYYKDIETLTEEDAFIALL